MSRRGPKARIDVDQILAVAADLIAMRGLDSFSMSALARRLGTSVSGLYLYFPSKQDLWIALQQRALTVYEEALQTARGAVGDECPTPAITRLYAVFRAYLYMDRRVPWAHQVIVAFMGATTPTLMDDAALAVNDVILRMLSIATEALDDAIATGVIEPGDAQTRAYLVWASLSGLDTFRKRDRLLPLPLQVDALAPLVFRNLMRGFGMSDVELDRVIAYVDGTTTA